MEMLPLHLEGLCAQCRHVTKIPRLAFSLLALSSFQSAHFLQFLFQCLSARAGSCQKNKYIHPEKSHSFTETTLISIPALTTVLTLDIPNQISTHFSPLRAWLSVVSSGWHARWLALDCGAFSWGRFLLLKEASSSWSATADLLALSHIGKLVGSTYLRWASWESGKNPLLPTSSWLLTKPFCQCNRMGKKRGGRRLANPPVVGVWQGGLGQMGRETCYWGTSGQETSEAYRVGKNNTHIWVKMKIC